MISILCLWACFLIQQWLNYCKFQELVERIEKLEGKV